MILLDTSGVLAVLDATESRHSRAIAVLHEDPGPFPLSPIVLAELDYMVTQRLGTLERSALLTDIELGVYKLAPFDTEDVRRAREVIDRYADLRLSLADASIAVLAERHDCHDVLTLDERDFRAMRGPGGRPFRILPADA